MLRKLGFSMQYALQRAAHAAEIATQSASPEERESWLAIERGWLKLAASYDVTDRLGIFIKEQGRKPREYESTRSFIPLVVRAHEEALWDLSIRTDEPTILPENP